MSANRNGSDDRARHDLRRLDHLQLPAHVNVWIRDGWRPGWLIACDHQPSGWYGLVQYRDEHQTEITGWMAAEQIAPSSAE
jgi:hypothetical protein